MAGFDDERPSGAPIDMERVIIDPDYRRSVLARLRRDRQLGESAHPAAGEIGSATLHDN